jgi:hypothetical protein
MERTLVALWFADIAGYSARAAKDSPTRRLDSVESAFLLPYFTSQPRWS